MSTRKTILSDDRKYRYTLWREWGAIRGGFRFDPNIDFYKGSPDQFVQFIGLNPSTADETKDDHTIRRCMNFAKSWNFGAMCMTNLFAFRATEPSDLRKEQFPIGDDNFSHVWNIAAEAGLILAAWGRHGR